MYKISYMHKIGQQIDAVPSTNQLIQYQNIIVQSQQQCCSSVHSKHQVSQASGQTGHVIVSSQRCVFSAAYHLIRSKVKRKRSCIMITTNAIWRKSNEKEEEDEVLIGGQVQRRSLPTVPESSQIVLNLASYRIMHRGLFFSYGYINTVVER